ncbi:hypothetical protein KTQ74_06270 [Pseudomonas chlororaphis]|uniref:hypothetical protein n=1 Tax=Pseudomonas chlororaphis TaxID=587753 RepID=UPI001E46AE77|nr:hypothetical protein [Pseudomonas chlororaphis]MCB2251494.1 hypothetical protein [Pseudomonas chlororaphis]
MNSALLLSNVVAIAVLVVFHFQPASHADQNLHAKSRYLQQSAQLAVIHSASQIPAAVQMANDPNTAVVPAATRPESWVF